MANMGFNFGIWTGTWFSSELTPHPKEGLKIAQSLAKYLEYLFSGKVSVLRLDIPLAPRREEFDVQEYEIHRYSRIFNKSQTPEVESLVAIREFKKGKPETYSAHLEFDMHTIDENVEASVRRYVQNLPGKPRVFTLLEVLDELA